ncbi:MAG: hypothetical protein JNK78_04015 [Planctomycetes bacterium]|nr:hypothetical protein [Planctomycetota bacterium]
MPLRPVVVPKSFAAAVACAVTGCATDGPTAAGSAFGRSGESYVAAPANVPATEPAAEAARPRASVGVADAGKRALDASAVVAAEALADVADTARAEERRLRETLANAPDPTEPALDLAAWLCDAERHGEALAVVESALPRTADPRLQVARAGLLRDVGRRRDAAALLARLVQERGGGALHPGLLLEWAELAWVEGDEAMAKSALASLDAAHAADPWCVEHRVAIEAVRTGVERSLRPALSIDDLLGDLRGAPEVGTRISAFGMLASIVRSHGDQAARDLLERVVAIAVADDAAEVRALGVGSIQPGPDAEMAIAAAFADPASAVRVAAADRSVAGLGAAGKTLLLDRLEAESDVQVGAAIHRALSRLVPDGPAWPEGAVPTRDLLADLARAWRARCAR